MTGSSSCGAGPGRKRTSDCADEVTLSRKGAKSRIRTNASTDVDRLLACNAELETEWQHYRICRC